MIEEMHLVVLQENDFDEGELFKKINSIFFSFWTEKVIQEHGPADDASVLFGTRKLPD